MPKPKPDLSDFEKKIPEKGCPLSRTEFTPQQRSDLDGALGARHISAKIISEVLTDWGYTISNQTVQRHRNQACSCPGGLMDADG